MKVKVITFVCFLKLLQLTVSGEDCSSLPPQIFKVYYGWPFSFHSPNVFDGLDYDEEDNYTDINCAITNAKSGEVLLNTTFKGSLYEADFYSYDDEITYNFGDINTSTPTEYKVHCQKDSNCWNYEFTLDPVELPSETCQQNLNRSHKYQTEVDYQGTFNARCDVPDGTEPEQLIYDYSGNTRVYWLYNCHDQLPPNATMRETAAESYDPSLHLSDVTYRIHPGFYTCVVEHNNMKRYRMHHHICVKPKVTTQLTIKCNNAVAQHGEDVEVECIVDAGSGRESTVAFTGRFKKQNSREEDDVNAEDSSCVGWVGEKGNGADKRISCELYQNDLRKCFFNTPTEEELNLQKTEVKMIYRIRNVKESDFGDYKAVILRADIEESTGFKISYDFAPGYIASNRLLIICLATIAGMSLICLILIYMCKVEIRWIWFKLFEPIEKEHKPYTAYLAYYYSKDMTKTKPSQLEAFVMNLNTRINSFGGNTFDRCRDPENEQYTAQSISAKLGECHRVVIILTPEYINDHWGMYEAYEAWKVVIETKTRIIFIIFPEAMNAINELGDEVKGTIKKAMKRHKVIEWDGSLPFSKRLQMHLEILMPKFSKDTKTDMNMDKNEYTAAKQNGYHGPLHVKDNNANVV